MKSQKTIRTLSVIASAALIVGAFTAGPADAKKKKKKPPVPAGCPVFTPIEPKSSSGQKAEVLEAPVAKVTDAATAEAPIKIEFEHGQAVYPNKVKEDTVFFNFQVESANPAPGLYIRQSWSSTSFSDMDLYLWDGATGDEVAHSGAANAAPFPIGPLPTGDRTGQETGAMGYESISGAPATNCAGYTVESRAYLTNGEKMTLTVWLGEAAAEE